MKFLVDGGLGDQMAATAVVREFHRTFPDEMIRVEGPLHMPIWDHNPHLRHGKTENGITAILGLHQYEGLGSIAHAFARQIAGFLKLDFQIVNDTPELFLTTAERAEAALRMLEIADPCRSCRDLPTMRARHRTKVALVDTNAMWPSRRYPQEPFEAAVAMMRARGWLVVQIGAVNPDSYGNVPFKIQADVDYRKKTTVREAAALMHHADVFVGNDSGGFHMAAGVGCPQVASFGVKKWYARAYWNTVPVFPYVPCLPACFDLCDRKGGAPGHHCLSTIPAWRVAEAVEWAYQRFGRW